MGGLPLVVELKLLGKILAEAGGWGNVVEKVEN